MNAALKHLMPIIHSGADISRILQEIVTWIGDIQAIGLAERIKKDRFRVSTVVGDRAAGLQGYEFHAGEGFLGQVVASVVPGYWSDVDHDPRMLFLLKMGSHLWQ